MSGNYTNLIFLRKGGYFQVKPTFERKIITIEGS